MGHRCKRRGVLRARARQFGLEFFRLELRSVWERAGADGITRPPLSGDATSSGSPASLPSCRTVFASSDSARYVDVMPMPMLMKACLLAR
jgi:hypothetical protein